MKIQNKSGRIKLLPDSVALRIAAGEVIDRPFSVVRELLDNSIDAKSTHIDLYVEGGGVDLIKVIDNGIGMSRNDLEISYLPYSTSKINTIEDLDKLQTLGFRGEALSSIAACSKLEITSKNRDTVSNKIIIHSSKVLSLSASPGSDGTVIEVSDLFYSIPARKKFLKRPSAEATACKKIFIEKAIPFPDISFKFFSDKKLKAFLPASGLKERISASYPDVFNRNLLHEFSSKHLDFELKIIAGDPALHRKDRRYIQIFLNNRKINEFALVQAIEYGFSEFLPGGNYPVAFLFININPALIDFNIHPAKKEVRFRNLPEIHRAVVDLIKSFLSTFEYNYTKSITDKEASRDFTGFTELIKEKNSQYSFGLNKPKKLSSGPDLHLGTIDNQRQLYHTGFTSQSEPEIVYMGQLFNLFLLTAINDIFYFIDQHAAHEKILFNEFKSKKGKTQELLIPLIFNLENEKSLLLKKDLYNYKSLGFIFEDLDNSKWQLLSLPEICSGKESIIINFIKKQKGTYKDLETELYSDLACKSAIKDGDIVDNITAMEIINKTLKLKNARCPHGRPVWFQVSREELFSLVGRT